MTRVKIDPVRWRPEPAPARARSGRGTAALPPLDVVDVGGPGPEDVLVGPDGAVWTGTADGAIRRIRAVPGGPALVDVVAETGGRPLGLEWLPDGRLLVCDARRGLLAVDVGGAGAVEELVTEVGGRRMLCCNNAAVAPDGTIWFSDSSARFGIDHWRADIFEHSGTGRLLRRDPDGTVEPVLDGLEFANGVGLLADGSAVLVAETGGYRVTRVRLDGERAGTAEVLLDNLPAFPDNVGVGPDGLLWVAMGSPRNRVVDLLAPAPPLVRRLVWATPERLQPQPADTVWTIGVDPVTGAVIHDLQGSHPGFRLTTGVRRHGDRVWLGSLVGTTIASFPLPA